MKVTQLRERIAKTLGMIARKGRVAMAGAAILAGGLTFLGEADGAELLINGSFELNSGQNGNNSGFGWLNTNDAKVFNVYNYSQVFYTPPVPPGAGNFYFHTVGINNAGGVYQTVDLTTAATPGQIDAGEASYDFSAYLAGFVPQLDHPEILLTFLDAATTQVGSTVLFDGDQFGGGSHFVDTVDGSPPTISKWKLYENSGIVPGGARFADVRIFNGTPNSNGNDPYADLVSLDITAEQTATPVPEPTSILFWVAGGWGWGALALRRRLRSERRRC